MNDKGVPEPSRPFPAAPSIVPDFLPPVSRGDAPPLPVAVIGAGFSGTMVALHLAAALPPDQPILLCERASFGCGAAYGTPNASHLLNVRAANMSAFPRQPEHFQAWLESVRQDCPDQVRETDAGLFASRGLYGRYLNSLLNRAVAGGPPRVRTLSAEVVDLEPAGAGYVLHSADGGRTAIAAAVLAIGNLPPVAAENRLHRTDPWAPGTTADLRPDLPVLIVGTGLTMADLTLSLHDAGFPGPVIALSRRGLLPQQHAPSKPWPTPALSPAERQSLTLLLTRVRWEVERAAARGVDWRGVIDSLRPITADLWRGLPAEQRQRFMRHLRPYWDVHRHRLSGPVSQQIAGLRESAYLQLRRGRIVEMQFCENEVDVAIRRRGSAGPERLTVQRVINATGLQTAANADSALVRALCGRGLARLDTMHLGVDVTDALRVVDRAGQPAANLWALGPIVRGVFWECIAVPDVRTQAEAVARSVAMFLARQQAAQ